MDKVIAIIKRELGQDVTADTRIEALECDSLEYLDLLLVIEQEAGIPQEHSQHYAKVGDFAR